MTDNTLTQSDTQPVFYVQPWAVDFAEQLLKFLASSERKVWIFGDGHKVYLRKSQRIHGRFIDIANVDVAVQGQKRFTGLLMLIEAMAVGSGFDGVFIENVLSDRFANHFRKLGWQEISDQGAPSFFRRGMR